MARPPHQPSSIGPGRRKGIHGLAINERNEREFLARVAERASWLGPVETAAAILNENPDVAECPQGFIRIQDECVPVDYPEYPPESEQETDETPEAPEDNEMAGFVEGLMNAITGGPAAFKQWMMSKANRPCPVAVAMQLYWLDEAIEHAEFALNSAVEAVTAGDPDNFLGNSNQQKY